MTDLRNLAIAAVAESGNKSPRMATLLLKLAACACQTSEDIGFFSALDTGDLLSAPPAYLLAGSGAIASPAYVQMGILIPGTTVGQPSGDVVRHLTVRHTAPGPISTVAYRLVRNGINVPGALVTLAIGPANDTKTVTFPAVALNVGDRITVSVQPAVNIVAGIVTNVLASFS